MLNLLNIFLSLDWKALVPHAGSMDKIALPAFYQGESPTVGFTLLNLNPTGGFQSPWSKVSPASYSLRMGLFLTSSGAQLAFQNTWADDSALGLKYAELTYDSAAITAALAAASSININWEAEITNTAGSIIKIQQPGTLYKQLITPSTATVPPTDTAATQAWSRASFIPKDGSNPQNQCDGFIILSRPSAIPILCYFDDNGEFHHEPQG